MRDENPAQIDDTDPDPLQDALGGAAAMIALDIVAGIAGSLAGSNLDQYKLSYMESMVREALALWSKDPSKLAEAFIVGKETENRPRYEESMNPAQRARVDAHVTRPE